MNLKPLKELPQVGYVCVMELHYETQRRFDTVHICVCMYPVLIMETTVYY